MCNHRFVDLNTGEQYCELLDEPCDKASLSICPLLKD